METYKRLIRKYPARFAVTVEEIELIDKLDNIIDSATRKYKTVTEDGAKIIVSDTAVKDIAAAVERAGFSVPDMVRLADDILSGRQWYTLLAILDEATGQVTFDSLLVLCNNERRVVSEATANDTNIAEHIAVLGLSEGFRYLPALFYDPLKQILYLFDKREQQPQGGFAMPDFRTIRQGAATNTLTKTYTARRKIPIDQFTGTATITKGDLIVNIANYSQQPIKLKASTYRLLDAITAKFTETGGKRATVEMPLNEYMELCGLSDVKEARQQVKDDLDALYRLSLSFQGKGKHSLNFIDMRLCAAKGIVNGVIQFSYSEPFYQILLQYPIMALPTGYFRINAKRNPNSPALLRKITEHKNMNVAKSNADTISVKTLLQCADSLPLYSEVSGHGGQPTQRIIEPFERDLDVLEDVLTWEYCHSNGEPLTEAELTALDYFTFEGLLIRVHWKEYPARPKELAIERQRKAAAAQPVKRKRGRPPKNKEQ